MCGFIHSSFVTEPVVTRTNQGSANTVIDEPIHVQELEDKSLGVLTPAQLEIALSALDQATQRGIPVVLVDTDAPFDRKVTYIGTDNRRGGQLAHGMQFGQSVGLQ